MSERQRGAANHWFGKTGPEHALYGSKRSEETKRKIGAAQVGAKHHSAKPVVCVDTGRVYEAVAEAVRWLRSLGKSKADDSAIIRVCRGTKMSAYGYRWAYADRPAPAPASDLAPSITIL